jgi:hypothetical protein
MPVESPVQDCTAEIGDRQNLLTRSSELPREQDSGLLGQRRNSGEGEQRPGPCQHVLDHLQEPEIGDPGERVAFHEPRPDVCKYAQRRFDRALGHNLQYELLRESQPVFDRG